MRQIIAALLTLFLLAVPAAASLETQPRQNAASIEHVKDWALSYWILLFDGSRLATTHGQRAIPLSWNAELIREMIPLRTIRIPGITCSVSAPGLVLLVPCDVRSALIPFVGPERITMLPTTVVPVDDTTFLSMMKR